MLPKTTLNFIHELAHMLRANIPRVRACILECAAHDRRVSNGELVLYRFHRHAGANDQWESRKHISELSDLLGVGFDAGAGPSYCNRIAVLQANRQIVFQAAT